MWCSLLTPSESNQLFRWSLPPATNIYNRGEGNTLFAPFVTKKMYKYECILMILIKTKGNFHLLQKGKQSGHGETNFSNDSDSGSESNQKFR